MLRLASRLQIKYLYGQSAIEVIDMEVDRFSAK